MEAPFAIITGSFPPAERGKVLGINAISISAGLAIGPSLGSAIASYVGWRFAFFINIPIGLFTLIWGSRIIPELKGKAGKIDGLGAIVAFVSLFTFLFFVNRAQNMEFGYVNCALLFFVLLGAVSFIWREKRAKDPLLNLSLFRNLTFSFANLSALLNFMAQYVIIFLTPFYLQMVLNYPINKVGLIMTSSPLAAILVAPLSGSLSDRLGTRWLSSIGASISAFSLFLMSGLPSSARVIAVFGDWLSLDLAQAFFNPLTIAL